MTDSAKHVWVPDPADLFTAARIVEENSGELTVSVDKTSELKHVRADEVERMNPPQFEQVGDMAELTYLNEPSVVHNLSSRWLNHKIYTYSGLFLVAVNPYARLQIYGDDTVRQYRGRLREDVEPHIFAVAEQAFRSMLSSNRDQSVLITGESGAGKTENTKKAIQYLSNVTHTQHEGHNIDERILQTNPILEAFGNAQTIRNANSSRFGKFIKINFVKNSENTASIAGASIEYYLLEKSRVVMQHSSERNYHVFYQLLAGASPALRAKLGLGTDPKQFAYLAGGATKIDGVDDGELYARLVEAFNVVGFSAGQVDEIMSIVAAILWLGQIEFRAASADQGAVVNAADVERAAALLGVPSDELTRAVCQPRVKVGKEYTTQSRTASQAQHTVNAIAKALYERLFGYIVTQLNARLAGESSGSGPCIGVLDIAGFEIFEKNSFEQLCINYTNEKLQQFFNHHMFVLEQQEYVKEKVDWDYVDYGSDLQPTIDFIEQTKSPMGVFSCLNEESMLPSGTERSFTEKLAKQWGQSNAKFTPSRLGDGFKIAHYAQTVDYSTDGWLEKNKDPLSDSVAEVLSSSNKRLVSSLFEAPESKKTKAMLRTVAQRYKEQLSDLMEHLSATHPHFVRCILPNTSKSSKVFDNRLVLEQLRYNGVLEGIRIARSGFPNRLEFLEFNKRYRPLAPKGVSGSLDSQQATVGILSQIELDTSLYKVGLSKVFFRNGVLAELEHRLEALVAKQATAVQALVRGALVRKRIRVALHRRQAAKVLAAAFRLSNKNANDPWWQLTDALKPLLLSKENLDSSRRDVHIQKLEKSLTRLQSEQVELISSKNELRADLIAALRAKEQLETEISGLKETSKEQIEAHEVAVSSAQSRDEASRKALNELGQTHSQLRQKFESLETELMTKVEAARAEVRFESERALEEVRSKHERAIEDARTEKAREIEESSAKELAKLQTARDVLKREHDDLQREHNDLQSSFRESQTKLQDVEKRFAESQKSLEESTKSLEESQKSLSESQKSLEESQKNHTALKMELAETVKTNEKALADEKSLHAAALASKKAKVEQTQAELEKVQGWLAKAKVELKTSVETKRRLLQLEEDHKATSASFDELKKSSVGGDKQLKEALAKNAQLEKDLSASRAELTACKEQLKTATDELETSNAGLKKAQTEAKAANDQLTKLHKDLDIATDNLLKSDEELNKLQREAKANQCQHSELSMEADKLRNEVEHLRRANLHVATVKAQAAAAEQQMMEQEKQISDLESALKKSQAKASELMNFASSRSSGAPPVSFEAHSQMAALRRELADAKRELAVSKRTSTAAVPVAAPGAASPRRRRGDAEQELVLVQHDLAAAEARVEECETELEQAKRTNAAYSLLRQKYEKLQREKAAIAQDRSQLLLGRSVDRGQTRELDVAKAQASDVKRLQSEVKVLQLNLVRTERELKETKVKLEDATDERHVEELKRKWRSAELGKLQLAKTVHNLSNPDEARKAAIMPDARRSPSESGEPMDPRDPPLVVSPPRALRNISNDRRVSEQSAHLAAEHVKNRQLEEALQVYKLRAAEFHTKLEKAEMAIEVAMRAEQTAKEKMESYRTRLDHIEDDHAAELARMRRQIVDTQRQLDARDETIERLKLKSSAGPSLQGQVKSMNGTLKDVTAERNRLVADKSRLERRLQELVESMNAQPRKLHEQILTLRQNEQQLIMEQSDLRWKIEQKERFVDTMRKNLKDVEERYERSQALIEKLHASEASKEMVLRRSQREIAEAKNARLMAERELQQYRSRDKGPVFI